MKNIADIIQNLNLAKIEKKQKYLYPRQEILKMFVDEINGARLEGGFNELSHSFIVTKMYDAQITSDFLLYWFYGYCKDSKNFSKCWWWSMKSQ